MSIQGGEVGSKKKRNLLIGSGPFLFERGPG